jgi:hypothetical protein
MSEFNINDIPQRDSVMDLESDSSNSQSNEVEAMNKTYMINSENKIKKKLQIASSSISPNTISKLKGTARGN